MKSKFLKMKWVIVGIIVVAFTSIVTLSSLSANFTELQSSVNNEDKIVKELSNITFNELCNEINSLSNKGVDLPDLLYHSVAFVNKVNDISNKNLIDIISDKKNSTNLKIIALQAITYIENRKLSDINEAIKKIVLNEKEDTIIRQNALWLLDETDESYDILEKLVFQQDEKLAFQALKKLNNDTPERAMGIANTLIKNKETNEKLRIAIKVISTQLAESKDNTEKDKWVSYCIEIHKNAIAEQDTLMCDTVIFSLSDMYYEKALYEIIDNENVDDAIKKFCIGQNYKVIINVLEDNPSKEDIEMAIKAMTLMPIDETVYVLDDVVKNSRFNYNLEPIHSQVLEPALEKWNQD